MNIATWCKTQNCAVEDKFSALWEWSEYNVFTSLKWDISEKSFHFLQSACSDQIPLLAQNCKDSYANMHIWRSEWNQNKNHYKNKRYLFLCFHRGAFSKIYYLGRLGWHLALPSSCFSRAKGTSRKKKDEFSSKHILRMTQQEFFLLYLWMEAGMRSG